MSCEPDSTMAYEWPSIFRAHSPFSGRHRPFKFALGITRVVRRSSRLIFDAPWTSIPLSKSSRIDQRLWDTRQITTFSAAHWILPVKSARKTSPWLFRRQLRFAELRCFGLFRGVKRHVNSVLLLVFRHNRAVMPCGKWHNLEPTHLLARWLMREGCYELSIKACWT